MHRYEKDFPARISVTLNGKPLIALLEEPGAMAAAFLRTSLAARDVPAACGLGDCGACMILIDGAPALACITPAAQLDGTSVDTRRGVQATEDGLDVARAVLRAIPADACGYCLGGNIVLGTWLRRSGAEKEVVEAAFETQDCACCGRQPYIDATLGGKAREGEGDGDGDTEGGQQDNAPSDEGATSS